MDDGNHQNWNRDEWESLKAGAPSDNYEEIDADMFKPVPKIPDEVPMLPDPSSLGLGLNDGVSDSLADSIDAVFFSNEGAGASSRTAKRASNILQLSAENKKLHYQLRELSERLEKVERRTHALGHHQKGLPTEPRPSNISPKDHLPTIPTSRLSIDSTTRLTPSTSRVSNEYTSTPRPTHERQGSQSTQLGSPASPYRATRI